MLAMLPDFDMTKLTILDQSAQVENCSAVRTAKARGATFVHASVTRDNWRALLAEHLRPGDSVIDLTFGISSIDVLEWCQSHKVSYINTAIERWEDELIPDNEATWIGADKGEGDWTESYKELYDRTLYARHQEISKKGFSETGPTAVLEHGCNPGLVSHFVKAALDNIVSTTLSDVPNGSKSEEMRKLLKTGNYAQIAMKLGLRVIHISEIDTQTTSQPKPEGCFVNTWSPMGFAEEALDWVQVGWGTHEEPLPSQLLPSEGSVNQVFVPMHAMEMVMNSYVPHQPIKGMCIPHGEADTITEHLTVYDKNAETAQGTKVTKAIYRPSVYYVYQCSDVAMDSLNEMRNKGYIPQSSYHVLTPDDEGLKGEDRVGVLLIFEDDPARVMRGETSNKKPWSYWYGSILSDVNNPLRNYNPTVVQVAASVVGAFKWIKANPNRGVCWPDDIPHDFILDEAMPFLGTVVSEHMKDYNPPASLQFTDFICQS
jgi:homospermidine synthase